MWLRRKEEEEPREKAGPAAAEAERAAGQEAIPSQRLADLEAARGATSIGKSVLIKGQVASKEDLFFDGEIEGTLELPGHRLSVGTSGKLQANIKAREIVVAGTIRGNVEAADKLTIRKNANLVGDIRAGSIAIEDGAYFKGSIDIIRPPAVSAAPVARPPSPPSPNAAAKANAG